MRIVEPSVEILTDINGEEILKHIERVGRVCYKSEDKITDTSAKKFVEMIIKSGHEAVIEHFNITVKFITNRGISHEIVRHRIASYAQESTRYVNYSKDKFGNEITVIKPSHISSKDVNGNYNESYEDWYIGCKMAEESYFKLIADGCKPQTARSVLPTCTKTEIMMTTNLREWRYFLKLRTSKAAHPDIRIIAIDLLNKFKAMIPVVFDDINVEVWYMVILVGESASGKSTIEKALVKNHGFQKVISYTTRPPRQGEIDGIDYHFITGEQFKKLEAENFFAEIGKYRDWYYGSSILDCKKDRMVAVLTPHGLRQMKKIDGLNITSFYINVPRRDRMIKILQRGDDPEECYRRSVSDIGMFDGIEDEVDYILNNEGYKEIADDTSYKIVQLLEKGGDV